MPAKNRTKQYQAQGYYHLYNRGVERRQIFIDAQDYDVFLSYLKDYLLPKDEEAIHKKLADPETHYKEKDKLLKMLRLNNYAEEIELVCYCLMPNHFHFLIFQHNEDSIERFLQSLFTRYTMYFNKKYRRVGHLFQDVYKAVPVTKDAQLLELSRYIHRQALFSRGRKPQGYKGQPSSLLDFTPKRNTQWVTSHHVLNFFSTTNNKLSYEDFALERGDGEIIAELTLE